MFDLLPHDSGDGLRQTLQAKCGPEDGAIDGYR